MKQSLTFYLTHLVMKLKGFKKDFSKDPIDYLKIRKGDVYHPKGSFYKKHISRLFKISNSSITEIGGNTSSGKLLIFVHGGAFVAGPGQHHWDSIKEISEQSSHTIWMSEYPKAPEHNITEISENMDAVYTAALASYQSNQITLIGDSAGATLIIALVQRLIKHERPLPTKLILISPVMDASMSNPEIKQVEAIDPMLSESGVRSAKKMCAGQLDLTDEMISPLYGRFERFPKTIICIATNDITYPDQKLAIEKLKKAAIDLEVLEGENMPHIWPLLPVMKEAKDALQEVISKLNS